MPARIGTPPTSGETAEVLSGETGGNQVQPEPPQGENVVPIPHTDSHLQ